MCKHKGLTSLSPKAFACTLFVRQNSQTQYSLSRIQIFSLNLGPCQTHTCKRKLQTDYQPITISSFRRYSKVGLGRPLVNMSPSCSAVSIFTTRISRLWISPRNQCVLTQHNTCCCVWWTRVVTSLPTLEHLHNVHCRILKRQSSYGITQWLGHVDDRK